MAILSGLLLTAWWLSFLTATPRQRRIDTSLGDLSYPLYLIHVPIQILAKNVFGATRSDVLALVAALLAVAASVLFTRATEPTLKEIRNKIRGRSLDSKAAALPSGYEYYPALEVAPDRFPSK